MLSTIFVFAGDTSALDVLASALKRWTSSTAVDKEASPKHATDDNDESKIPFLLTSKRFKMRNFYVVLEINITLIIRENFFEVINVLVCSFLLQQNC